MRALYALKSNVYEFIVFLAVNIEELTNAASTRRFIVNMGLLLVMIFSFLHSTALNPSRIIGIEVRNGPVGN